ncbi:MAG TPA: hypothetical protein VMT35_09315 [Ignavibacteriaceae bacterium]|nr:hypothetical protein [Ignavibacteriaceae bacterium]
MKIYVYILLNELKKFVIGSGECIPKLENNRLVFYEVFDTLNEADERLKTILSWPERKIRFLISLVNPALTDWKEELLNLPEYLGSTQNY